ncbi:MAG: aspartate aminotransferase family protein [Planctomycetes bacterium]|nr:aspartate aminotransferase family protein [Planctomycetota bacterium]
MQLREIDAYARLPLHVVGAEGNELILEGGRRLLDLYGGHCVNTLGAGDAGLGRVIQEQWQRLSFATNLLDHEPRHGFLTAFEPNLPSCDGGWSVFLSNSGAEANESALKHALAFTRRRKVVFFKGAFHGRTAAAAAVSDMKLAAFPSTPFDVVKLPWNDVEMAAKAIDTTVGAVILEPYQSLAGVTEPSMEFLGTLRRLCDRTGAVLIFDEVQTGNGRLGTPWASQHTGVVPDSFTTAKGAAGGLPIGITVIRTKMAQAVSGKLFGSTFGGGPLVLAAAAVVARRVGQPEFLANVRATSEALKVAGLRGPIASVRGAGLLLGLVVKPELKAATVRDLLLEQGVLVGTSDDPQVLRLSPALTLTPADALALGRALETLEVKA